MTEWHLQIQVKNFEVMRVEGDRTAAQNDCISLTRYRSEMRLSELLWMLLGGCPLVVQADKTTLGTEGAHKLLWVVVPSVDSNLNVLNCFPSNCLSVF